MQTQKINRLFEEKEKQIIREASAIVREIARKELALMEFELFYSVIIPEESRVKSNEAVQRIRKEKWEKTLEKAKGDEEKAMFIYDEI